MKQAQDFGFKAGDRVRAKREIDRLPDFTVPEGTLGTVVLCMNSVGLLSVLPDIQISGAEPWENEIQWYRSDDSLDDIPQDLELLK